MYYVYIYYDPNTLFPFYVGKGKGDRDTSHLQRSTLAKENRRFYHHLKHLKKYGQAPIIIRYKTELDEDIALSIEMKLIKEIGRLGYDEGGILLNVSEGGDNPPNHKGRRFENRKSPSTKGEPGRQWSSEEKERHRSLMRETMNNDDIRERCRETKRGKPGQIMSDEVKKKIGDAQRGKLSPAKSKSKMGESNPMFGMKWYNDGVSQRMFRPGDEPDGWVVGKKKIAVPC